MELELKGTCSIFEAKKELERDNLDEKVVYVGIGTFVKREESCDQQLPAFLQKYQTNNSSNGSSRSTTNPSFVVKVWLFDPQFWLAKPLVLETKQQRNQWKQTADGVFERGQVQMRCVGQVLEDDEALLFKCVEAYLLRLLQKEATVFCGVFAVPYLRVPENLHLVQMAERIKEQLPPSRFQNFVYFHLAAYAKYLSNPTQGTKVWVLRGKKFNQDIAVMKEVLRSDISEEELFRNGPTFGISSYAMDPGTKFILKINEFGSIDYDQLQKQIREAISKEINPPQFLEEDEIELDRIDEFWAKLSS